MPETSWSGFPRLQSAKLWISSEDGVHALQLYNPYSHYGKVAKSVLCRLPEPMARRLLATLRDTGKQQRLNALCARIRAIQGGEDAVISFSTGTPGPHRKMTAQIRSPGGPLAYAKIAETEAAAELVQQELAALSFLAARGSIPFAIPNLIGADPSTPHGLLVQGGPPTSGMARSVALGQNDLRVLDSLASMECREVPLEDILAARLPPQAGIESLPEHRRDSFHNAVDFVEQGFAAIAVKTSYAHGDYAPWNTLELSDGSLFVFDWEYAAAGTPALNDLVHFIFMPLILVQRLHPRTIVERLFTALNTPSARRIIQRSGISPDQTTLYVLLYLLAAANRGTDSNHAVNPVVVDCMHHILIRTGDPREPRRVLVSAYACEPHEGSEPGVGWNMVNAIGRNNEAWIITRRNNRAVIESELAEHPDSRLHFQYVDLPRWASFWKKGGRGVRTYYYLWQLLAWRQARRLHREFDFDLGHHITFVSDWLYTFQALLPIPVVWGPIGSNPLIPAQLAFDNKAVVRDRVRYLFQSTVRVIDPLFWASVLRADHIVGIEGSVGRRFPFSAMKNKRFTAHTAIGVEELPPAVGKEADARDRAFRVLSVGKLLPVKGFHLAIAAFAEFARRVPDSELLIIGEGPLDKQLAALSQRLGVAEKVKFRDWLPRTEVLEAMRAADLFLYPTFEGAGMVVLEAMASQLPVVCLDFGGPGLMVGEQCGYHAPVAGRSETEQDLAAALVRYANNRAMLREHGINARRHVEERYLWSARDKTIQQWYEGL